MLRKTYKMKYKRYWFKRKTYGWGWYPSTLEGWLVLLAWAILFVFSIIKMDHEWAKNFLFILIITGLLIVICYRKVKNQDGNGERNNTYILKTI